MLDQTSDPVRASVAAGPDRVRQLGFVALLVGTLGIAFAPILAKLAVNLDQSVGGADTAMLSPVAVAFWRMAIATPIFLLALGRERGRHAAPSATRNDWRLLLPGLCFALDLGIWHWSFEFTSVANSTLAVNFAVILVALIGWLWFKERFNWRFPVGALLALTGMVLMVGFSFVGTSQSWIGDLMGLGCAFFYSAYQLTSKAMLRHYRVSVVMTFGTGAAAVFLLLGAALSPGRLLPVTAAGWLCVVGLALVSQVLGQGLIAFGMRCLPVGLVSVVLVLQPVFAALLGWMILGQSLSLTQVFAGGLVMLGIYVARRGSTCA